MSALKSGTKARVAWLMAVAMALLVSGPVYAGGSGSSGPGIIGSQGPTQAQVIDRARFEHALDVALDDPIYKAEVEAILIAVNMPKGPDINPAIASIAMDFKKAMTLAAADFTDLSYNNVLTIVRTSFEVALAPVKAKFPGTGQAISIMKLSAAFSTAFIYTYFFWGQY